AGIGGQTIVAGEPRGVYGLRGGGTNQYSKYGTLSGLWTSKANTPAAIAKGGALTTDGAGTIYALRGGGTQAFYAYNIAAGSWTAKANTGVNVDEGGALVYLNGHVYALMGNGTAFRRYDITNNTWLARAATPNNVKKGGALTTDGTYIYALRGDRQKTFWRYDPANDAGGWTAMAPVPANVGWGGALTYLGGYIYALRGDGQKSFYRYSIATNTWTAMAPTPGNVGDGGALTNDGTYIYAFQGKTTAFWRYDIAANKWTALASVNFAGNVGQGGALVYAPAVNPQGYFTAMKAHPTLVSAGHSVKVELDLRANAAANNLTPSALTVIPTGGASASCGSPVLKSADDDIADINDPVIFEWTCSVTPVSYTHL
ncbi:MAG: hypothetical protein N2439_00885, partial [Anaerolineae bacterium]|nr:hypothetical protein [Anaerolineae bacterium]